MVSKVEPVEGINIALPQGTKNHISEQRLAYSEQQTVVSRWSLLAGEPVGGKNLEVLHIDFAGRINIRAAAEVIG